MVDQKVVPKVESMGSSTAVSLVSLKVGLLVDVLVALLAARLVSW